MVDRGYIQRNDFNVRSFTDLNKYERYCVSIYGDQIDVNRCYSGVMTRPGVFYQSIDFDTSSCVPFGEVDNTEVDDFLHVWCFKPLPNKKIDLEILPTRINVAVLCANSVCNILFDIKPEWMVEYCNEYGLECVLARIDGDKHEAILGAEKWVYCINDGGIDVKGNTSLQAAVNGCDCSDHTAWNEFILRRRMECDVKYLNVLEEGSCLLLKSKGHTCDMCYEIINSKGAIIIHEDKYDRFSAQPPMVFCINCELNSIRKMGYCETCSDWFQQFEMLKLRDEILCVKCMRREIQSYGGIQCMHGGHKVDWIRAKHEYMYGGFERIEIEFNDDDIMTKNGKPICTDCFLTLPIVTIRG